MPSFIPASLNLARLYLSLGKRRAAIRTVEDAWKENPHPELAALWMEMAPPAKKSLSVYDSGKPAYEWMQKLASLNPDHLDSRLALGHAALDAGLWREARDKLVQAQDFRAMARLEQAETRNETKTREWLEQSIDQPPDRKWVCTACNHTAETWQPLCPECRGFNTAEWMTPDATYHAVENISLPAPSALI